MSLSIDIKKHFADFSLDLAFEAGNETLGFLGASGCGKSLTLRCIAGVETPDEGKIVVNNTVFFDKAANKKARINLKPQERKTALLFQNYQLFPNLTVAQNISASLPPKMPKEEKTHLIDEQLTRFGLETFAKRYPLQLSGGQQQRVALARMLAAKPGILMLDEPFSALDSHLKSGLEQDLLQLFKQFQGSILYVSHDIDEAFRFCDRIAVVSEGHLEEIDTKDRIIYEPQTLATLRLSGCKNTTDARYIDPHHAFLPDWGITVSSSKIIDPNVRYCGMRAKFITEADTPGTNTFRVRIDHVSDSRFERTLLISFLDKESAPSGACYSQADAANTDSSNTSHANHTPIIQWHINKLTADRPLPEVGDERLIHLSDNGLHFVTR